jgi:hypothetical protein
MHALCYLRLNAKKQRFCIWWIIFSNLRHRHTGIARHHSSL